MLTVALALLAVWPSAASPFHEPKKWILVAGAVVGVLLTIRKPVRWQWSAMPLVVLATLQGGLETIAFAWAMVTWPALPAPRKWMWRVLLIAAVVSAGVVLLQVAGVGSGDVSGRLRLFGTLGNPDFVASIFVPLVILFSALPRKGERTFAWALGLVVLAVTRSYATVLSTFAAVIATRRWRLLLVAVLCALPLASRELKTTVEGRLYLIKVALPHVKEAPVLGQGPRAVEANWPAWELAYWQARCSDAACVEAHPEGRFAGLQDHTHADWLDWLLERGVLGLLALGLALAVPLRAAWRTNELVFTALVAVLARSFVDFPLERPADLAMLAMVCSLALKVRSFEALDSAREERESANHHANDHVQLAPRGACPRADERSEDRRVPSEGDGGAQEARPRQEG